jgi:hypothetical protein
MTMEHSGPHLDDEALSALLDEAADAATAAHVAACPSCAARLNRLQAATAALRDAPLERLDELTRRRLLNRAMDAAPTIGAGSSRRHFLLRPGAAAAAAVVSLLDRENRSGNERDSTAASALAATGFLGDLGEISHRDTVRRRLGAATTLDESTAKTADSAAEGAPPPPAAPAATDTGAGAGAGTAGAGATADRRTRDQQAHPEPFAAGPLVPQRAALPGGDQEAADHCTAVVTSGPAGGDRVLSTAVGTWRGNPAVVTAVVDDETGTVEVFVTARADCGLLESYRL